MDKAGLEKMLKMTEQDSETDAIMGLRGMQGGFKSEGTTLSEAVLFAFDNLALLKQRKASAAPVIDQAKPAAPAAPPPVTTSGMPNCRVSGPGQIELIAPGASSGLVLPLPGSSADAAEEIALHVKDALVAAIINKSRFKVKLLDVKNVRGEITETVMQAEYDRAGMATVRLWAAVRGEAAACATVLRKALAQAFPDLYAS